MSPACDFKPAGTALGEHFSRAAGRAATSERGYNRAQEHKDSETGDDSPVASEEVPTALARRAARTGFVCRSDRPLGAAPLLTRKISARTEV